MSDDRNDRNDRGNRNTREDHNNREDREERDDTNENISLGNGSNNDLDGESSPTRLRDDSSSPTRLPDRESSPTRLGADGQPPADRRLPGEGPLPQLFDHDFDTLQNLLSLFEEGDNLYSDKVRLALCCGYFRHVSLMFEHDFATPEEAFDLLANHEDGIFVTRLCKWNRPKTMLLVYLKDPHPSRPAALAFKVEAGKLAVPGRFGKF